MLTIDDLTIWRDEQSATLRCLRLKSPHPDPVSRDLERLREQRISELIERIEREIEQRAPYPESSGAPPH